MINHINYDKIDNRLCNLQLVSQLENCLKSAKNNVKGPPRPVVAINMTTDERHYFPSMNRPGRELGIYSSSVQNICDKINYSTRSKFNDYWCRFEYLN